MNHATLSPLGSPLVLPVKFFLYALAIAWLPLTGHGQNVSGSSDKPLSAYRDKNRVLLVFAASPQDGAYIDQMKLWQGEKAGFDDRQLVVMLVFGNAKNTPPKTLEPLLPLMKKYGIDSNSFSVVLIGKDGHDAFHTAKPTPASVLYGIIDAMPMRRAETKRNLPASPVPTATPRKPDLDHDE